MGDFLDDIIAKGLTLDRSSTSKSSRPGDHTLTEPTNFHKLAKQADAIVLGIVRTRCTTCGTIHEYPSQWLLYRYGKNYSWTSAALESEPHLPREVRTMEIENAYCSRCFPTSSVNGRDYQREPVSDRGEAEPKEPDSAA